MCVAQTKNKKSHLSCFVCRKRRSSDDGCWQRLKQKIARSWTTVTTEKQRVIRLITYSTNRKPKRQRRKKKRIQSFRCYFLLISFNGEKRGKLLVWFRVQCAFIRNMRVTIPNIDKNERNTFDCRMNNLLAKWFAFISCFLFNFVLVFCSLAFFAFSQNVELNLIFLRRSEIPFVSHSFDRKWIQQKTENISGIFLVAFAPRPSNKTIKYRTIFRFRENYFK